MEFKYNRSRGHFDRGQIFLELILSLSTVIFLIGFTMELALMSRPQKYSTNKSHNTSVLERESSATKTTRNFNINPRFKKIFKGHNKNDID